MEPLFPGFDPSKVKPETLMKLSQLIQELPPEKLQQMQQLMHNLRAGFDVRREMEAFEESLPPDFREALMSIIAQDQSQGRPQREERPTELPGNRREARLTVLRAVAEGRLSPDEACLMLFPEN
jgi:hypothetical protein